MLTGAIENVWIGGHEKNHVWIWLPSGSLIFHNEMWNNRAMVSGECLLLDRHVNQVPQYLSANCDRKRTFLCETRKIFELLYITFLKILRIKLMITGGKYIMIASYYYP